MNQQKKVFDVIIIGGGPAGATAGIYTTRANLSTLVIENKMAGGQVLLTNEIDNYPGFEKISGFDLGQKFAKHAENLGVEFVFDNISAIQLDEKEKQIKTEYSGTFFGRTVIICTGASPRKLNLQSEERLVGKGVNYCATCDGAFFKGKEVCVVGGGNAAVEEAITLSHIAKKVILLHMLDDFQAFPKLVSELKKIANVEIRLNTKVVELSGETKLEKVVCETNGKRFDLHVSGIFVSIGRVPNNGIFKNVVKLDKDGYVDADEKLHTNVSGVFAAGDCRKKEIRQIVTACADGAIAANEAASFLLQNK